LALIIIVLLIPSIFFGIPEAQTVVSALAGQQLVRQGKGIAALHTVIASAVVATLTSVALFPISLEMFPAIYAQIRPLLGPIVLLLSVALLVRSKNILLSSVVFVLSGMLGYYALGSAMADPFLPLFSGMFAMGAALTYQKGSIPPQRNESLPNSFLLFSLLGVAGGFLADLLPGISSPSQVAVFLALFVPMDSLSYLSAIAAVAVSEAVFSFSTMVSIGKARMGATAWLDKTFSIEQNLLFILVLFMVTIAIAAVLLYCVRRMFAGIASMDFTVFNRLLALYLLVVVFVIDGWIGIVVFLLASALGYITINIDAERRNLMGAVIVPTLLLLFRVFI